jgi:hypothetical protein
MCGSITTGHVFELWIREGQEKLKREVKNLISALQLDVPWQAQQACRLWCMEIMLRVGNSMRGHNLGSVGIASDLYTWRCTQKLWKYVKLKTSFLISYFVYRLLKCSVRNYWNLCKLYNHTCTYDVHDRLYVEDVKVYHLFLFQLNAYNTLNTYILSSVTSYTFRYSFHHLQG